MNIPCVRVSSAQSKSKWSYFGCARYMIRTSDWRVVPVAAAKSDRRSRSLADKDAAELVDKEGLVLIGGVRGRLSLVDAETVLYWLLKRDLKEEVECLRAYCSLLRLGGDGEWHPVNSR